jgi:hypothetical protein
MPTEPTFSLAYLKDNIPIANADELKIISLTTKEEQGLYCRYEYVKILVLISERLIELYKRKISNKSVFFLRK